MKKSLELNLTHLFNLTDETGLFQHARYHIPDRKHGYCIDDNARALLVLNLVKKKHGNDLNIDPYLRTYLSFIDHAYNPSTKKFRNFMSYEKHWLEESGSEDSQGRTIWAIGTLACNPNFQEIQYYLEKLIKHSLEIAGELTHPRAIAYSLLGLVEYYEQDWKNGIQIKKKIQEQAEKLINIFGDKPNSEWLWHDKMVTYDNSRIPQAMISSGFILEDHQLMKKGFELLDWLIQHQFDNGIFSPFGNEKWFTPENKSEYDQQPIEAWGMIDACLCAVKVNQNPKYYEYALMAFNWFSGKNTIGQSLYDPVTGGCCDGFSKTGINKNQGAESTLAWLHSLFVIELMQK